MDQGIISLRAPVSAAKMEGWVAEQIESLRRRGRPVGVRLGRLSPAAPEQGGDWVIDVDVRDRGVRLLDDVPLSSLLVELEVLGLRPQLLVDEAPGREAFTSAARAAAPGAAFGDLLWPPYSLAPVDRRHLVN